MYVNFVSSICMNPVPVSVCCICFASIHPGYLLPSLKIRIKYGTKLLAFFAVLNLSKLNKALRWEDRLGLVSLSKVNLLGSGLQLSTRILEKWV